MTPRARCIAAATLVALGATAAPAVCEAQAPTGFVAVQVVDSTGQAVADAELRLSRVRDGAQLASGRAGADGGAALAAPAADEPYRVVARRVGFRPDSARVVVRAGDTVRVALVLRPAVAALPTVTVRERRTVSPYFRPFIDSTEIATATVARSYLRTGWDVVERLRPVMKGEWWKGCPALQHVFVNGQRMSSNTIISPQSVLASIPAEDILEIRYLNCWDTSMPGVAGNNAAYVVLKPGRAYRP